MDTLVKTHHVTWRSYQHMVIVEAVRSVVRPMHSSVLNAFMRLRQLDKKSDRFEKLFWTCFSWRVARMCEVNVNPVIVTMAELALCEELD
eukprot:192372-Karenia_brevis.AAC.1